MKKLAKIELNNHIGGGWLSFAGGFGCVHGLGAAAGTLLTGPAAIASAASLGIHSCILGAMDAIEF